MIDYIMRLDALIDVCIGCNEEFPNEPCEPNDCKIKRALSVIPTADVVEVVRCKDCKYRSKEWYEDKRNKDGGYWLVCCENDAIAERIYGLAQDNDYCSYGEKRDD